MAASYVIGVFAEGESMYEIKKADSPLAYFELLAAIPRRSHDEEAVSLALAAFAKEEGLACKRDEAGNVLIHKEASPGREGEETVILQGHMDMVYVTGDENTHAYGMPITLIRDDKEGTIRAECTSLGADNGLGVSMGLALLTDETLSHPPIDAIFTVNEEDGLEGAGKLDPSWIRGTRLINMDGEVEDTVTVGCAGAFRSEIRLEVTREAKPDLVPITLRVNGLYGGHSGLEIHKGRANANVVLGFVLWKLGEALELYIGSVAGGSHMNSIATEAEALVFVPGKYADKAIEYVNDLAKEKAVCLVKEDEGFALTAKRVRQEAESVPMSLESSNAVRRSYLLLPNGVRAMSKDVEGLVQTSTNLGMVRTEGDIVRFISNPRSSIRAELEEMAAVYRAVAASAGAEAIADSAYPSWSYAEKSPLRDIYMAVYEEKFGKRQQEEILHGGLECGVLCEKRPGLDAIAIGSNIWNVHSQGEYFSVASLDRVYETVKEVLRRI